MQASLVAALALLRRHRLSIALCAIAWISLALASGYDLNWDILNYHFYNGFAALHGKTFVNIQPAMLQNYFAPFLDAIFYALVRISPPAFVIGITAAFQSLAFPMVYMIGVRVLPRKQALRPILLALTILGALAPVSIWEAGTPRGDTITAVLVIAALLIVIDSIRRSTPLTRRRALAVGVLAGAAAALKLTNAAFALGLAAALVLAIATSTGAARRQWFFATLYTGFSTGAAFLLIYGPWGWLVYSHFGNPFFPNFNQIFHSPYAETSSYADFNFALPTWADKLAFPFKRTADSAGVFDFRMALTLPLCMLMLIVAPYRERATDSATSIDRAAALALAGFVLTSYIGWLLFFPVNRYLSAVDMVAPIAFIALAIQLFAHRATLAVAMTCLVVALSASAYRTRHLYIAPELRGHDLSGDYLGVSFEPPAGIDHSVVAMLSDLPTPFVIPFFPRTTTFVRLQGSLLYWNPGYNPLNAESTAEQRRAVFGNAMGHEICDRLDHAQSLFFLRLLPEDSPHDVAAMRYFGLENVNAECVRIDNKAGMNIALCPAKRMATPECRVASSQLQGATELALAPNHTRDDE